MALTPVTNGARHPVDLEGGRVLAPGETAKVDLASEHNQALVDTGQLVAGSAAKGRNRNKSEEDR